MIDPSDTSLLKEWSAGGSEAAFTVLARRYGGLLYHAAIRQTGREDLAGEAAQNALLILARKAPHLAGFTSLAGWLHRTACYEAAKLSRRERRHEARMKQFHLHHGEDDSDTSWQAVAPLLDKALDALPEKDRQVIFLKYFDGLSFEQMARQFGGEAAAWRQRGSRAVDRLRGTLAKGGVAVSSSALATGLGTTLSQAAPTSVLTTLSASPAAAAAAISWQTLTLHSSHLLKMNPAAVITVALVLSIIPLGTQAKAIADARQRVALLEEGAAHDLASADAQRSRQIPVSRQNTAINLFSLADALMAAKQGDQVKKFITEQQVDALDADELEQLLITSGDLEMGADKRLLLVRTLFREFCKLALKSGIPCERVLALATRLATQIGTKKGQVWGLASANLSHWMEADPDAALAWYRGARESGIPGDPQSDTIFASHAFNVLHGRDPAEAIEFFRSSSDSERQAIIAGGGGKGNPDLMLGLAAEIGDERLRSFALLEVFRDSEGKSPEEVHAWFDRIQPSVNEAAQLLAAAAEGHGGSISAAEVGNRLDWLRAAGTGLDASQAAGIFLSDAVRSNPGAASSILDAEWKRYPDERMLATYMFRCFSEEDLILDAIPRSRLITDPALRDATLQGMLLSTRSDSQARELARKGGLPQVEIDRILPEKP